MSEYKIKIDTTMCIIDKECEVRNVVNKMFNEPIIYKEIDYPFEVVIKLDDSKMSESEIKSFLTAKADAVIETIKSNKKNCIWFKNVKLKSIDKIIL